jgi:hypothetical protein
MKMATVAVEVLQNCWRQVANKMRLVLRLITSENWTSYNICAESHLANWQNAVPPAHELIILVQTPA